MNSSQYLIMGNRCMHELKTLKPAQVAERMDSENEADSSIQVTELGKSVLTLSEVLLTFDRESKMFNIKLSDDVEARTVILTKTQVEVDGKNNLIVMIRDVTDKVRLQKHQLKQKKENLRTFIIQKDLDGLFQKHCDEIDEIFTHLQINEDVTLQNLAFDLKKTN